MSARKSRLVNWTWAMGLGLALGMGLACGPGAGSHQKEGGQTSKAAEGAQAAPTPESSTQAATSEAPTWLTGYTMGHALDSDGTIPAAQQAHEFSAGQTVYVGMTITQAPAGASVQVAFEDASGQAVSQDEKKVPMGATSLYFDAGDTSSWKPGDYRVEISADGRPVNEQHFTVSASGGAPT